MAFEYGLSRTIIAIECDLIFQRTKEALARKRSEGAVLGRTVGRKSSQVKRSGHEIEIQSLLDKHTSKSAIGRIFGVNRMTVDFFLKERMKK
jgi:DNA invertase Pin-like site-specific DNA recombinase